MTLHQRAQKTPKAELRVASENVYTAAKESAEKNQEKELEKSLGISVGKERRDIEQKRKTRVQNMDNTFPVDISILWKDLTQLYPLRALSDSERFNARWRFLVSIMIITVHSYQFYQNMEYGVPYIPISRTWGAFRQSGLFLTIVVSLGVAIATVLVSTIFRRRYKSELLRIQEEVNKIPIITEKTKEEKKRERDAVHYNNIQEVNGIPTYEMKNRVPIRQSAGAIVGGHLGTGLFT